MLSLLLEGGQFHAYLTARAQSAIPRIFASFTYQTYSEYSNALWLLVNIKLLNTFLVSCFLSHSNPNLPCFSLPPQLTRNAVSPAVSGVDVILCLTMMTQLLFPSGMLVTWPALGGVVWVWVWWRSLWCISFEGNNLQHWPVHSVWST